MKTHIIAQTISAVTQAFCTDAQKLMHACDTDSVSARHTSWYILHLQGISNATIAQYFNVSQRTVQQALCSYHTRCKQMRYLRSVCAMLTKQLLESESE